MIDPLGEGDLGSDIVPSATTGAGTGGGGPKTVPLNPRAGEWWQLDEYPYGGTADPWLSVAVISNAQADSTARPGDDPVFTVASPHGRGELARRRFAPYPRHTPPVRYADPPMTERECE